MMRSNPLTSMQKCYDDCFLVCSTAIYFEQQNNEAEALRSWKNALDQIYYHNAYRLPSQYRPRSETEKALQASLKQLELQCKERIDLLEALKQSREEASGTGNSENSGDSSFASTTRTVSNADGGGWLGNGTIPPISYPDLAKPPSLPSRPLPPVPRASSGSIRPSIMDPPRQVSQQSINLLSPTLPTVEKRRSRTPSPEKKSGLLRTLRQPGKTSGSGAKPRKSAVYKSQPPLAAAGAATSAWSSGSRPVSQTSSIQEMSSNGARVSSYPIVPDISSPPRSARESTDRSTRSRDQGGTTLETDLSNRLSLSTESTPRHSEDRPSPYPRAPRNVAGFSTSESLSDTPALQSSVISTPASISRRRSKSPPRLSNSGLPSLSYRKEYSQPSKEMNPEDAVQQARRLRGLAPTSPAAVSPSDDGRIKRKALNHRPPANTRIARNTRTSSEDDFSSSGNDRPLATPRQSRRSRKPDPSRPLTPSTEASVESDGGSKDKAWGEKVKQLLKKLPRGVDEAAAKQILNEIVIKGDEVHWADVAGLDIAKNALKENVVYPFLRPDLFSGLREPARGMLLFGPPGTGKTMLARAVATESRSTFFAISASSLTSKFLGDSEKLVRALFGLAKELAPSIIFVDEIDSLLSSRLDSGEHEASRRIKTEFLIQWSDLARAAAGSQQTDKERGDASRVLVLAATNLPWAIDEAARRRFVRRQYIPLPEDSVRATQLSTLLSHQKHNLTPRDIAKLVVMTEGFSGSDITALAKDAAMGPLRSLGELLLHTPMDAIRPIGFVDFQASLTTIRPSVSKQGLKQFEDWAAEYGERGG